MNSSLTMTHYTLTTGQGWMGGRPRVEAHVFIAVSTRNRHPAQGYFPMTD